MRLIFSILTTLVLVLGAPIGFVDVARAQAYDPEAPCGRDANGFPLQCTRPDPNANQEAACLTTIRLENCLPYHYRACTQGFATACRVYQIGANCNGGDPNLCNYYVEILRANRSCALDSNQQACAWLQSQNF